MQEGIAMKRALFALFFCLAPGIALPAQDHEGLIAFPGAEGGGKFSTGGRGGDVYHVTNLNDSGEGSLREGINTMTGPRTIVFDVAGTIALNSNIYITNKSGLTIAGQTAPGKGITIKDYALRFSACDNIIVRYIRCRYGDENKVSGVSDPDAINFGNRCTQVILDHVSLSWGIDGNGDFNDNGFFTIQWCIFSEALNESLHGKGAHAMSSSFRRSIGASTMHHNIYGTSRNRHPSTEGASNPFEFINNLNYNWSGQHNISGTQFNLMNNYYRSGPEFDENAYPLRYKNNWGRPPSHAYFEGNFFDIPGELGPMYTNDAYTAIDFNEGDTRATSSYQTTTRDVFEAFEQFDAVKYAYARDNIELATEAYQSCLQFSGCYSPNSIERDSVDLRFLKSVENRTGTLIDSQDEVGGWDSYEAIYRPDHWDTDGDGMPDEWEYAKGFNPDDPVDGNGDVNKDGYTNLEDYLSSLAHSYFSTAPVINTVSPADNQIFLSTSSSDVEVEVHSNDFDGEVSRLELFLDQGLVMAYDDSTSIFTTLENVSPGMHHILIRARDDQGNETTVSRMVYVGKEEVRVCIEEAPFGRVALTPSGGIYTEGIEVQLTPIPDKGYQFMGWIKDINSSVQPLSIHTAEDVTLKPVFIPDDLKSIYKSIKINFQSATASGPADYVEDYGFEYGLNSDNYTFGWLEGNNIAGGTTSSHGIWKHYAKFENYGREFSWGIALPNGIYRIRLGLGGETGIYPQISETELKINVEGIIVEDPDGVDLLDEHVLDSVPVTDGQLTLSSVEESRICFMEIEKEEFLPDRQLVVQDGSGTGSYFEQDAALVIAYPPGEGEVFDQWTGDTAYLEDIHSSATFVFMPDTNVSISANYKNALAQEGYYLCVANGSGTGHYAVGEQVVVSAPETIPGGDFSHWEYDGLQEVSIVENQRTFTFTTVSANVVFEAVYRMREPLTGHDIYQAEEALWDDASSAERYHGGYFGLGYVNFKEDQGSYVHFSDIDGKEGGLFSIKLRYSLADPDREGVVIINGTRDTVVMTETGSWSEWSEIEVRGSLEPGSGNTIRIETTGDDLGYLDQIELVQLNTTRVESGHMESKLNVRCYPNPIGEEALVFFELSRASDVQLQLYNLQGLRVRELSKGACPAGINELSLNKEDLTSGLYILRVVSDQNESKIKVLIN